MGSLAEDRFRLLMAAESADEVLDLVRSSNPDWSVGSCFTVTVSNPPYQKNVGNENSTKAIPIWPDFVYVGDAVSKYGVFVNPGRWLKGGIGTGLVEIRDYFLIKGKLDKAIVLPNSIFPNTSIGDITIEFLNYSTFTEKAIIGQLIGSETVYKEYSDSLDVQIDEESEAIVVKIINFNLAHNIEPSLWIGGQETRTKKPSSVLVRPDADYGIMGARMKRDTDYFIASDERNPTVEYLKVYYLSPSKELSERFVPLSEMQDTAKNNERIPKWQAMITKTECQMIYRNLRGVIEPNALCTPTWLCKNFETKEEVLNYYSYLRTYFYRFLVSVRRVSHVAYANVHRFVPDLENITNPRTGKVGWDSDWIDDDLVELYKDVLTEDDWRHIKKFAIDADGGRGDYENGWVFPDGTTRHSLTLPEDNETVTE